MTRIVALICGIVLGACVTPASTTCADGRRCPATKVCDEIHGLCVLSEQLLSCETIDDGQSCAIRGQSVGTCRDGVCLEPVCGDGIQQGTEECDGDDLGIGPLDPRECTAHGYYGGGAVVTCLPSCQLDTSECIGICGDGVLQPGESCDGTDLGGITDCLDLAYYNPGPVGCNALCRYDDASCTGACGDGIRDPLEICDGGPPSTTCLSFGYDAGFLDCLPASCAPAFAECHQIGWKPIDFANAAGTLLGFSSSSPTSAYAAFEADGVRSYDGTSWRLETDVPTTSDVYSPAPGVAWAIGNIGLYGLANGMWSRVASIGGAPIRAFLAGTGVADVYLFLSGRAYRYDGLGWSGAIAPPSVLDVWAGSPTDYWLITDNGGTTGVSRGSLNTWSPMPTPLDEVSSVWGAGSTVFVGGRQASRPSVARYDGSSWQVFDLSVALGTDNGPVMVGGTTAAHAFAFITDRGALAHFDGMHWLRTAAVPEQLFTIGAIGSEVYIGGKSSYLARESASSIASIGQQVPNRDGGSAVWGRSCTDVFVATSTLNPADVSSIQHFDGTQWTTELSGTGRVILALTGTSDGAVYASTDNGEVLQRVGTTWTVMQSFGPPALNAIWAAPGGIVIAVGSGGWIRRYDGASWTSVQHSANSYNAISGTSPSDVYAVGNRSGRGVAYRYDGSAWTDDVLPVTGPLNAIWGDSTGAIIAVADDGSALHRAGGVWTQKVANGGGDLESVWGTTANDVFAVSETGTIVHHDGTRWAPLRPTAGTRPRDIWADATCTYIVGGETPSSLELTRLYRSVPW